MYFEVVEVNSKWDQSEIQVVSKRVDSSVEVKAKLIEVISKYLCPKFGSLELLFEGRLHDNALCHKEAPPFGVCIWHLSPQRLLACAEFSRSDIKVNRA